MTKITLTRKPILAGEILSEEFLKPMNITQKQFADHIKVDVKVINRLINGKTSLSAELALKISASFDTTPEFWLSFQYALDLFEAKRKLSQLPAKIK